MTLAWAAGCRNKNTGTWPGRLISKRRLTAAVLGKEPLEVTAWHCSSLLKRVGKERMPGALKEEQLADGATIRRCIYTPHSLRATTATLLLDANVDIIKVKDLLGHRHVTTTQIYDKRRRSTSESASHLLAI